MATTNHIMPAHRARKSGQTRTAGDTEPGERFLHILIFFPLLTLTFFFGGARPWIWQGAVGLFFLLLGARYFLHGSTFSAQGVRRLFALLLLVPLLQILPLPVALLELLSPVRAQWAKGLLEFGRLAGTTLSYDPLTTWMHLGWWLFLLVFATLLGQALCCKTTKYPLWLLHGLFVLAGFEALYGILQALIPSLGVLWDINAATGLAYKGYARGTFINRNHFAAFLGLLWPMLLAYILVLKSPRKLEQILDKREQAQVLIQKKAIAVLCLALVILGLVFSQSRGGILSALLAFTLLYFFAGLRQKRVALVLAGCWIIMLGYGAIIGFDGIANRFSQIEQGAAGRVEIWKDGWTAVLDHPLTGTGLGTYPAVGRAYQNAVGPQQRSQHAHNDYLETVVEMGLPLGGIFILGIWGLWVRQAFVLWRGRNSMNPDRLLLAAGSLAALGGYMFHAWVEFNNAIPANQLTAVLVAVFHFSVVCDTKNQVQVDESEQQGGQLKK
jgi:O-antigen ligase